MRPSEAIKAAFLYLSSRALTMVADFLARRRAKRALDATFLFVCPPKSTFRFLASRGQMQIYKIFVHYSIVRTKVHVLLKYMTCTIEVHAN